MAVDEALARFVREGKSPPVLRVYEWTGPSVTIGCFQKMDSINLSYCAETEIPIVRRVTGGRAVLHDQELTYSFSAPTGNGPFADGLINSYKKISRAFCRAISMFGISPEARTVRIPEAGTVRNPLCFHSASFAEITIENRKIVGSAQKRWRDGLLQQGSIPYSFDEEKTKRVFDIRGPVKLGERMTGLKELLPGLDIGRFREAVKVSFQEVFQTTLVPSSLSREEHLLARELENLRYLSQAWNLQR
jgi:lipoate-protein ligase A